MLVTSMFVFFYVQEQKARTPIIEYYIYEQIKASSAQREMVETYCSNNSYVLKVVSLDTIESQKIARNLGVTLIPSLIMYDEHGKETKRAAGQAEIRQVLGSCAGEANVNARPPAPDEGR